MHWQQYHTVAADAAIGGLESHQATQGGRGANGAAGIGAQGTEHEARRHRSAGAAAGAISEVVTVPGAARWGPGQVKGGTTMRELPAGAGPRCAPTAPQPGSVGA
ncbi:hypothetical protein NKDENANG_03819 [Candidatus Entotheonellaceae bacterium PAL068K]